MRYSQLCVALVGGMLLFLVAACSDSSNLGLDVGSSPLEGGEPSTKQVIPDSLYSTTQAPVTGRLLQREQDTWRFLTGHVDDPIAGELEAKGSLDFLGRSSLPDDILEAGTDSLTVELRLTPSFLHGDTSSTVDVRVYDLAEEAEMNLATSDTTFPAESQPITSEPISPTDSLVTIELPSAWVEDHRETLQDTTDGGSSFSENFHGFKLTAPDSEIVVGFSPENATLRLLQEPDSVIADFRGIKSFTHVERLSEPSLPEDPNSGEEYRLLQDGVGQGLSMEWNFEAPPLDTLKNAPLNRAEIFIPTDTSALQESLDEPGYSNFVRPLARGFRITATRRPDAPSCSAVGTLRISDTECALPLVPQEAPGAALVGNDTAFPIFQETLQNAPVFSVYRIEVADRANTNIEASGTVNPGLPSTLPVLIPPSDTTGGTVEGPRVTLTVTQL